MEEPITQGTTKRIAVVTGANKRIGLEICRQLASHGVTVVLTARDEGRGIESFEKLKNSGICDILFRQLDVADPSSVASLANFIKTQFGKLDILEHEYVRFRKLVEETLETRETAEECLNINYYGMKRVTEALIPFLQLAKSPRVVNVTSNYGLLRYIPSESIRKAMGDVDEQTEERLDEVLQSFLNDLKEEKLKENGWPTCPTAYKLSKVAMSTYTRILAKRYPTVCINCVHPGFVKTDITFNTGTSTVEEGAQGPVMLALLPDGSPSGPFYEKTKAFSFE